ncbi:ABC transporter substrate-binding protein [Denitromonas ohlonensis]|uniref:Diguanylate cyclase n=2 Tax=Denitromonas TaxID=139331 RepID=A0A557RTD8_9RHOO|nr:ABC transporter substrate-binding protein [Denitromonas ohlonensis]TVO68430.1 diguanylate cyclase [Denitromonas ohlonensis]TVO74708.1 diguanylate cyclase [Denitromonas ohlonensis]
MKNGFARFTRKLMGFAKSLGVALILLSAGQALADDSVVLQLRWVHQFQFAGYYAALEKGYYAAAGLDVEIRAAGPNKPTPLEELTKGNAHYGVGNSGLVVAYQQGAPVVALAAIFQRSPNVWLTLEASHLITPLDLAGKRLMMTPSVENAELLSLLAMEGIARDRLNIVPSSFDIDDLITGRVDAFNAYATNEPYLLEQLGIAYRIIDPHDYGIDFYSDVLFTTEDELLRHPQRVAAFQAASLKGWDYAMAHPEEIVDLIRQRYNPEKSRDHLLFEATTIRTIMQPDLIQIGHMNPLRWQRIADTFVRQGMNTPARPLDGFLYDPAPKPVAAWLIYALVAALVVIGIAVLITGFMHRANRSLLAAKRSLQSSEYRLNMALVAAKQGWFDVDLRSGKVAVSPEYLRMIGHAAAELETDVTSWMARVHDEDRPGVREAFDACIASGGPTTLAYRRQTKTGDWKWIESVGKIIEWDDAHRATRMIGVHTDITERKRLEAEILDLALHDHLTGLPNRSLLAERLGQAIAASKRTGRYGAALFLDLDNFKPLNDEHGHDIGDLLLIEVARRLKSCIREIDTAARFGGDEFVLVLGELNEDVDTATIEALQVAQKIGAALAAPYVLTASGDGRGRTLEYHCTASIGVALFGNDRVDRSSILSRADSAMYLAKHAGGGRVQLVVPDGR